MQIQGRTLQMQIQGKRLMLTLSQKIQRVFNCYAEWCGKQKQSVRDIFVGRKALLRREVRGKLQDLFGLPGSL